MCEFQADCVLGLLRWFFSVCLSYWVTDWLTSDTNAVLPMKVSAKHFFVVVTDWALPEVCLEAVIFSEKNINVNLVESWQMCKCSTNSNVINPKSNIFLWKWSWKGEFFHQKVCIWWYLVQNMWQCDVKYFHVSWLDILLWSNWMFCSLALLSD